MTDFIAMIYEWFGYSTDLGDHLRGLDPVTCRDYTGTNLYFDVFIWMIIINILLFALMYLVIDKLTAKYSSKGACWLTAIVGLIINFAIACSLPGTVDACPHLHFDNADFALFGLANAFWSLVIFALLTSFPFPRNFSANCRLTTLWKP